MDSLRVDELTELAIGDLLEELDPHSTYVPNSDLEISNASLESKFEGVGIEFLIVQDTIQVISALPGGPAESVGIQAGDRILSTDGVSIPGHRISNKEVFKRFRGPKGSQVEIGIIRPGVQGLQKFMVTRNTISSHSIEAAFILKPGVGYLKISRFSDNTFLECLEKLKLLREEGARSFVIDIRDNPGGYLDRATRLANEFLPENRLMVYTEGRAKKYNQKYETNGKGQFQNAPLVVLVNEGSASASEIFSGAIQDNDRGIIVGRRTYGKGLVQVPISLKDGSELRLTISRYFTPSGRCIQKPYKGEENGYEDDLNLRYTKGEFFFPDSIKIEKSEEFQTITGRSVFGGGGISPDYFVPLDSINTNHFMLEIMKNNLFREFSNMYYKKYESELQLVKKRMDAKNFNLKPDAWPSFIQMVEKRNIPWPVESQRLKNELYINHFLKAYVARLLWGENGFYQVISAKDPVIQSGLIHLQEAQKLLLASSKK